MLGNETFVQWCDGLGLSAPTVAIIAALRVLPPSRLVRAAAGNATTRYVSYKMGWVVATESRTVELPFARAADADEEVLEYYDQPPAILLEYCSLRGRRLPLISHTPDFFVLRRDGAGWVECKTEEDLERLSARNPHRYRRDEDGCWCCPPGAVYAATLGLSYRVFSSAEIDWVQQRNLIFLDGYLRAAHCLVSATVVARVKALVGAAPGLPLSELLSQASPDVVYRLIATKRLYVDLRSAPLAEPDRVQVFCDGARAGAHTTSTVLLQQRSPNRPASAICVGAACAWDGAPWQIVNVGAQTIALLGQQGRTVTLARADFSSLVAQGQITGIMPPEQSAREQAAHELILAASPADLETAARRSRIVQAHRSGDSGTGDQTPERTVRLWAARWRAAGELYGAPFAFVGLLPRYRQAGNRTPKLRPEVRALAEDFIMHRYETLTGGTKRGVWGALVNVCEERGLVAPSYKTFWLLVKQRPQYEQARKREGPRAAYGREPFYYELTLSTPRHGDRPWEIGHIDHSPGDVELVCSQTGKNLGTCWMTFLTDAYSRRILGLYLTFHPPSTVSCMMVLRECVRRHSRLPETVVVDGGPEFRSTHFETLLACYDCHKRTRPHGKPRHGSICERLFGTSMTQVLHSLQGNTTVRRSVRGVTKGVDPRRHACWTLGALHEHLCVWAYEVYDTLEHPALGQSPRAAYVRGMAQSGQRAHLRIPYDEDFTLQTLPTTRRGTARVQISRGVKINNIYYWTVDDAFRDPQVERTQVPVRYDPFDAGRAYAYVRGRWRPCISEYYTRFQSRSVAEVLFASEEVRRRQTCHNGRARFQVTARQLADHLAAAESTEATLRRLRAVETKGSTAVIAGSLRDGPVVRGAAALPQEETVVSGGVDCGTPCSADERELCEEYR